MFSRSKRYINNHDRIKHTTERVGGQVGALHHVESTVAASGIAEELIINLDGGHINTTGAGKRSFEAMTAVIYRPEALVSNDKGTHNTLTSKRSSCVIKACTNDGSGNCSWHNTGSLDCT